MQIEEKFSLITVPLINLDSTFPYICYKKINCVCHRSRFFNFQP